MFLQTLPTSKTFSISTPFPKQVLVFTCRQYKSFEKTMWKGEIARDEQFLLFLQSILPVRSDLRHFDKSLYEIVVCKLFEFWRA